MYLSIVFLCPKSLPRRYFKAQVLPVSVHGIPCLGTWTLRVSKSEQNQVFRKSGPTSCERSRLLQQSGRDEAGPSRVRSCQTEIELSPLPALLGFRVEGHRWLGQRLVVKASRRSRHKCSHTTRSGQDNS